MKVTKRDGRIVDYNEEKIRNAITNAFLAVDNELTEESKNKINVIVTSITNKNKDLDVEEIQNIIEEKLMASSRKDVAKQYILYRAERTKNRNKKSPTRKIIKEKLSAKNVKRQNANVDEYSFGGRVGEASDVTLKQIALEEYVSDMARENHENNKIYIHDLNSYPVGNHNCLTLPFDDLLENGFNTRQTDVRPANSLNTAFQLIAVIFQLQSLQQFGGVSASHLDWTMIPYFRKSFYKHINSVRNILPFVNEIELDKNTVVNTSIDDKTYKGKWYNLFKRYIWKKALKLTKSELEQAVEGMYHNLNTLQSRSGNQLPFTSINYGTCTLHEGRLIIKALLNGSIKGVGKFHKTSIFPCGIFQCMNGVNRHKGEPNYDLFRLALKSTAQRLYPNYANIDWSGNKGYDINNPKTYFATMGCRTANGYDINAEEGQNPQLKDGRGNICPVTIILPTLAMEATNNVGTDDSDIIAHFMSLLDTKIHEAKDMLIERFNWIASQNPQSAMFMYENHIMYGYKEEEGIISALKHGTLAIGQLGLAEALQILIGCDHTEERGMTLAKNIEQLFKDRCAEFKEQYKLNFGVYYTPAENLCYTAMQKFKEQYGEIKNVSDKEFFTNSMHVPVWKQMTPFEKIDIESQLTGYSSAGCITYVELDGGVKNNIDALEQIVNYAMDKDIPYFAINVPNDMCNDCGYTDEINDECPMCGSKKIRRLRRVTGYLTGDYESSFNEGKQQEVKMRVKHARFNG